MRLGTVRPGALTYLNKEALLNSLKRISVNSSTEQVLGVGVSDSNGNLVTIFPIRSDFNTRSDNYTVPANGVIVDVSSTPRNRYSIQVKGVGGSPVAWDVRIEGSLDGVNFTQIIRHINTVNTDGEVIWLTTQAPSLYFRSRVESLTLGLASRITVTILGID